MVLSLKPGRREHLMLCMLGMAMGSVLLALGVLLMAQKPPQSTCKSAVEKATAGREVAVEVLETSTVDAALVTVGTPMCLSGAVLVCWGLQGTLLALQLKRNPTAQPRPFAKPSFVAFLVAAVCLWISIFFSFFAAPVLMELCTSFQCGPVWAMNGAIADESLQCYEGHADMRDVCMDQDICCGCQLSWDGGDTPQLVCREMVDWACQCATLESVSSYVTLLFASMFSATALLFGLAARRRCRSCIDVGECYESDDEESASKLSDVQTLEPRIEDQPSIGESPRSSEQGAIADSQLAPAGAPPPQEVDGACLPEPPTRVSV